MYKKFTIPRGMPKSYARKILLIMRLTTVILLASLMQVSAKTFAQKVTLKQNSITISQVFSELKKQTGYRVIYFSNKIDDKKIIKVNFNETPIEEVMNKILIGQPVTFTIQNKTIILKQEGKTFVDNLLDVFNNIDVHGRIVDESGNGLSGAVIKLKDGKKIAISDSNGYFTLNAVDENSTLIISYLGFQVKEIKVKKDLGDIRLLQVSGQLDSVNIVSTGYQTLSRESTTGSYVQIDNKLLNRSVSTNVLDRIKDVVPGVYFQSQDPQLRTPARFPNAKNSGITIRGESTFSASKQPLIILDNFPYEGEISNINPNDVESITILKDASSAAIWGARSANGVIVITTKKGKFNQDMKIDLSSNVTIIDKPNLKYSTNFLDSKGYIEVERYLFNQGYFDTQINNNTSYPVVSPAVELMIKLKSEANGTQRAQIQTQLDDLSLKDVRDDYSKFVYQKAINQQYSLGVRGGTKRMSYTLSLGHDNDKNNLIGNNYHRTSLSFINTYKILPNLDITTAINYSNNQTTTNNDFAYGTYSAIGSPYSKIFPYASLVDNSGNSQSVFHGFRNTYLEQTQSEGFLDWSYRPIDEIKNSDNSTKVTDMLLRFDAQYKITKNLTASLLYQNERQLIAARNLRSVNSYYVRNLINQFSVYNQTTGSFLYNFPKGDILELQNTNWYQNNVRGQLAYNKQFNDQQFNFIVGSEIKELKTEGYNRTSYGYNEQFGSSTNNLNFGTFYPTNPSGSDLLPSNDGSTFGFLNRTVSYYTIGTYGFKERYTFNVSARKDGANLFGAKANDKIKPFWSAGLGWNLHKESFFKIDWISYLRIRTTYGYQGNTYENGSAYLTGSYSTDSNNGSPIIFVTGAPNPRLQWEKIKNKNLGIDFSTKNNTISGSLEYYNKIGQNLIQSTILAPQTGFTTYQANTASTSTKGIDLTLQSINVNRKIKWQTTLIFSAIKDKIVKYDALRNSSSISIPGYAVGKPLAAIFSYKWAGLDPLNGNPRGYLNNAISENYTAIRNNYNPDSLVYNGSAIPTIYGAFRNDLSYKGFNLSINIIYRLGFVFRRSSTSLNYTDVLQSGQNSDYNLRWQKPGDELITNIPSLVYPSNSNRNLFFSNSETLVENGDNIRLQDIRLGYELPSNIFRAFKLSKINIFAYANNIGIIWRANKLGIDPNSVGSSATALYPNQFALSFGLTANF